MICRNCGTEIADKAIICFKCGAGTTDPVRRPADVRARRGSRRLQLLLILVLIVLAILAFVFGHSAFGI